MGLLKNYITIDNKCDSLENDLKKECEKRQKIYFEISEVIEEILRKYDVYDCTKMDIICKDDIVKICFYDDITIYNDSIGEIEQVIGGEMFNIDFNRHNPWFVIYFKAKN